MIFRDSSRLLIICEGMNTSTIPVYVAETARSNRRGRMVAVQLCIVIVSLRTDVLSLSLMVI